ncbi:MAG: hypothetical protein OXK81_05540 [Chloroflexota bacterium]|nr:hypothetical protein [Chloroflexota bacterium]
MEAVRKTAKEAQSHLIPLREELRKSARKLKSSLARIPTGFHVIEKCGWFPDLEMDSGLVALLSKAGPDAVDSELSKWFKGRLWDIETELTKYHLHRAGLICDAFWAHSEERYSLSVLSFLSQADGIWHDSFSSNVFRKEERKHICALHSVRDHRSVIGLFLSPLGQALPVWLSESERDDSFSNLNRHLVLHGLDTNYDTEEYSLKAMSFLWWSHQLLDMLKGD